MHLFSVASVRRYRQWESSVPRAATPSTAVLPILCPLASGTGGSLSSQQQMNECRPEEVPDKTKECCLQVYLSTTLFTNWRLPTLPLGLAVPSALMGLTSLFGMDRGGSPSLLPPLYFVRERLRDFFFTILSNLAL